MIVGTTEAAKILNISSSRLRRLLIEGRVEGAYKSGKMWLIPLFNGKPIIAKGKRGPAPRWRNPVKPAQAKIYVNRNQVDANKKNSSTNPVISVHRGQVSTPAYEVEILGGCRVVYRPHAPISSGATVWLETLNPVKIIA